MKITSVAACPRRSCFIVTMRNKTCEFSFSYLKHKPSSKNPVVAVWRDKDAGYEAFTYELKDGRGDTVLTDQVLYYNKDPKIVREAMLYQLSCQAQELLKQRRLSKRGVARQLSIQPAQLYRLLDPTFYGKTIDQMVRLFASLGEEVEIRVKPAA